MCRHCLKLSLLLLGVFLPSVSLPPAFGQQSVSDPWAIDNDLFARNPAAVRRLQTMHRKDLELRTESLKATIRVTETDIARDGKTLTELKRDGTDRDKSKIESRITERVSQLWLLEFELEQVKAEGLRLQLREQEQGLIERKAYKAQWIADKVKGIVDGANTETARPRQSQDDQTDAPESSN